jgi:hypothetical protein
VAPLADQHARLIGALHLSLSVRECGGVFKERAAV